MPGYGAPEDPNAEFEALGPKGVRNALATGKWDAEKRAAARLWVEAQDTRAWQKERAAKSPDAQSFGMKIRSFPWVRYILPIAGAVVGLGMMFQRLRF